MWEMLLHFNIVGLAVGAIIALVATEFFRSLVGDVVIPLIGSFVNIKGLEDETFVLNGNQIFYGKFLSITIYSVIMLSIVSLFIKFIILPVTKDVIEREKAKGDHISNINDRLKEIHELWQGM